MPISLMDSTNQNDWSHEFITCIWYINQMHQMQMINMTHHFTLIPPWVSDCYLYTNKKWWLVLSINHWTVWLIFDFHIISTTFVIFKLTKMLLVSLSPWGLILRGNYHLLNQRTLIYSTNWDDITYIDWRAFFIYMRISWVYICTWLYVYQYPCVYSAHIYP